VPSELSYAQMDGDVQMHRYVQINKYKKILNACLIGRGGSGSYWEILDTDPPKRPNQTRFVFKFSSLCILLFKENRKVPYFLF
jgi:hypothetical protein